MSVNRISKMLRNAVTVRGLSPDLKACLRLRAAHNARSMEAETPAILEAALSAPEDESTDLGAFARGLFAPLGGIDLELPARSPPRHPPRLSETMKVTTEADDAPTAVEPPAPEPVVAPPSAVPPANTRGRRR